MCTKEYARLKEFVAQGQFYLKTVADLADNRALLQTEPPNSELAQMAKDGRERASIPVKFRNDRGEAITLVEGGKYRAPEQTPKAIASNR